MSDAESFRSLVKKYELASYNWVLVRLSPDPICCTVSGDPAPFDLPPPVLRPDGTLAPHPKPLPVLKTATPSRRIGG